jgi:hypothetical protein
LANPPVAANELNDSDAADHACFADFTDVFALAGLSAITSWRV